MEKAKRDGVPVKVEPPIGKDLVAVPLNPALPAKKRLPFLNDVAHAVNDSVRKLKPGMPLKKRVSSWLLENPIPFAGIEAR
jgi:hypothetical protein